MAVETANDAATLEPPARRARRGHLATIDAGCAAAAIGYAARLADRVLIPFRSPR